MRNIKIGSDTKRLFFGFEVSAPWPESLPKGRVLKEEARHLTLVFLGQTDYSKLQPLLTQLPLPPFHVGLAGEFQKIQFLPEARPKVVSWNPKFENSSLLDYVRTLTAWLKEKEIKIYEHEDFLPHVTLCRAPFSFHEWRNSFQKLPLIIKDLHLYESLGQLNYLPIWTYSLLPPFEELEHTGDIAFKIYGESLHQICFHALTALAFKAPELLKYRQENFPLETIEDVILHLNRAIAQEDISAGCPFKAVSFHGDIVVEREGILSWEMIVDV